MQIVYMTKGESVYMTVAGNGAEGTENAGQGTEKGGQGKGFAILMKSLKIC